MQDRPDKVVLGERDFYRYLGDALEMRGEFDPNLTPWEAGLDSALVVELVYAIEDLGVEISDELDWQRARFCDLYRLYVVETAAP